MIMQVIPPKKVADRLCLMSKNERGLFIRKLASALGFSTQAIYKAFDRKAFYELPKYYRDAIRRITGLKPDILNSEEMYLLFDSSEKKYIAKPQSEVGESSNQEVA